MTCTGCQDCPFVNGGGAVDHHEIHITVETQDVAGFQKLCSEMDVKAIVIEFQTNLRNTDTHVMTSTQIKGTDWSAETFAKSIAFRLAAAGFKVIRTKIETTIRGDRFDL